jgi:hypothetical protein
MNMFRSPSRMLCLSCFLLAAPLSWVFAREGDEVSSRMLVAWEKFSERQELFQSYGARAEVALTMLKMEQERSQLEAAVRSLRIQIDGMPGRRNNLQQAVYEQWLYARQELTNTDQALAELRLRMQQLNEEALLQAQANGKRVKPFDRAGLLNEFNRVDREGHAAFVALQKAVDAQSRKNGQTRADVIESVMEKLSSGDAAARLGPPQPFLTEFKRFLGGSSRPKPLKGGGKNKTRR